MPALSATAAYADADDYKARFGQLDTANDDAINDDLTAVSRYLDKKLSRFFGQEGTTGSPVFRDYVPEYPLTPGRPLNWAESENPFRWGGYSRSIDIQDLVSLTSIYVDLNNDGVPERLLTTGEYELLPRNAPKGSEPEPYRAIHVPAWNRSFIGFQHNRLARVTGVWGWPAVPSAIKTATIEYTALWRLESPRASTEITELGVSRATSRRAQEILDAIPAVYHRGRVV